MKVLLTSLNQLRLPDPVPPLGACYVGAAIRKDGHNCRIFDLNFFVDYREALKKEIEDTKPDVLAFSLRNIDNTAFPHSVCYINDYKKVIDLCRVTLPGAPVVLGGPGFSIFPKELKNTFSADFGIVGEGEESIRVLLREIESGGIDNARKKFENSDGLVFPNANPKVGFPDYIPARDLIDVNTYFKEGGSLNVQTKRGCAFKCSYCTYPLIEGRCVRARSPVDVVDEMELCLKEFGVDYFFIIDSVFNYPESHSDAIADEIIRRNLNIQWTAYAAPKFSEKSVLEKFKKSGCTSLDFGTDAASPKTLESLDKGFTQDEILQSAKWCREVGIKVNHSLIFGVPGETKETVDDSINTIIESRPTAVTAMVGIRIYPNTPLADYLVKKDWIKREEIGIEPVFYIEDGMKEYIFSRLEEAAKNSMSWIIPGTEKRMNQRYFERLRSRGFKGPLWKLLE